MEELERLGPNPQVRAMLADARGESFGAFMHDDPEYLPKACDLQADLRDLLPAPLTGFTPP